MKITIMFLIQVLSIFAVMVCFVAFAVYGLVFFITDQLYTVMTSLGRPQDEVQ